MTDEHKICFIVCSNSEYFLEECLFYINQLEVPTGYNIDVISIYGAESMTNGYNEGMCATDAKYKVYLHQDVFIIYKGFLQAILDIFRSDPAIGMIGMVGAPKMSVGGVMWYGVREGTIYGCDPSIGDYGTYRYKMEDGLHEVEAIDGLMMITSTDIAWREDKFDGWDFYDVSQSFEFRRQGYRVVVPEQLCPWCMHDDGVINLINYEKYRKICMAEYPEYFYPERFQVGKSKYQLRDGRTRVAIIARNQFEEVKSLLEVMEAVTELQEGQIIIVDNGSEDGLRHWLRRQRDIGYIICSDVIESYAEILNEVTRQFITEEDLFVLSPDLMPLPGCMEALCEVLYENAGPGAVCARTDLNSFADGKSFLEAAEYAIGHGNTKERIEIEVLPAEAVLIRNEMLKQLEFDSRLFLPENVMADFSSRGKEKGHHYYEVQNAYFYRISDSREIYTKILGRDFDEKALELIQKHNSGK